MKNRINYYNGLSPAERVAYAEATWDEAFNRNRDAMEMLEYIFFNDKETWEKMNRGKN